ncbi:MAG: hypothetical protein R2823_08835 [Acidimicrobiia bacterium]
MSLVLAVVAAVVLAPPFGAASATAVDDTDGLVVEVVVQFDAAAEAVIVRPHSDFEELPPTAMAVQDDGTWMAWVQLPTAQNWQITFEGFHPDGEVDLSESTDLLSLGVDPVVITSEVTAPLPSQPLIPAGSWWLIIGVVLAVAALGVLAAWTFGADRTSAVADAHTEIAAIDDE